jgi:uncharacterized membrane protein YkoI
MFRVAALLGIAVVAWCGAFAAPSTAAESGCSPTSAQAQNGNDEDCEDSASPQDRARHARDQGEARPLTDVLDRLARQWPGEVLRIELERHGGRLVYEARILDAKWRRLELVLDAKSLEPVAGD